MEGYERKANSMVCSFCDKAFDRPSHLKRHARVHTGEKPFPCVICEKAFSTASSLQTHHRIHLGIKPYRCDVCLKQFTAGSNLYYHRFTHCKLKPHRCQQIDCERSFATPSELRGHSYRHSGSWPHTCTICRTGFSKASALGKHLQTHALTSDASTPTKEVPFGFRIEDILSESFGQNFKQRATRGPQNNQIAY